MGKRHISLEFVLKIIRVIVGCAGFYIAAFVEPRIGGILIAAAAILIAIPTK